jgi:hypothetical protein
MQDVSNTLKKNQKKTHHNNNNNNNNNNSLQRRQHGVCGQGRYQRRNVADLIALKTTPPCRM